jgi:hypothetical protein
VISTLQLAPQEPAIIQMREVGDYSNDGVLGPKDRPLGLMPFDWLMLFTGTMLGSFIVLFF